MRDDNTTVDLSTGVRTSASAAPTPGGGCGAPGQPATRAKRDIRKDPDTDAPIPDTATRFRALAIVERLLHVSGQFGLARSDAIAREDATERAEREISADAQRLIEERADGTAAQFDADADALAAGDLEV